MPKFSTFQEAAAHNTQAFCNVPECYKHRSGVSTYCKSHRNAAARAGHPLQSVRTYQARHTVEREKVRAIVLNNSTHPGIITATQWLQSWINAVMRGQADALAPEDIRRLVDSGVSAQDILIEAASFFIYQQYNQHKFLNDAAVDIALSMTVLQLAPAAKKTRRNPDGSTTVVRQDVKTAPRKKVGRYIRSHLIDLFVNLKKTLEDNSCAAITTKAAMRAPLVFPAVLMPVTASEPVDLPWAT